ncbi:MAG: DNA-binding response regulator [Candidatus Eremiobacter antarcticus]|nr:response regulator transcription factor [Candidatus Eremiobacteraeota bacterium]MBC5807491.1 response regulator transcription factor [Candidatus Eremiobacteraeota bacterium]PZR61452.1 MAG: DNA-binding response regulator [Candidatus Eremiobacter sp. RRmetagenome_bin22]
MTPSAKVLVIDDEQRIREMLELGLSREGFSVQSARDARQALAVVSSWAPDVIILDVMMPQIDGFALLPMLRKQTHAPVVMLSAKGDIPDKVTGLTLGADDYLAKPFALEELVARLSAALRRPQLVTPDTLQFGDLHVQVSSREVRRGETKIGLTNREFTLLLTFLRSPGRIFSKEQLLDLVWGYDFEGDTGVVETYMSYLRAKVDVVPDRKLLHTVRGAGYCLKDPSASP